MVLILRKSTEESTRVRLSTGQNPSSTPPIFRNKPNGKSYVAPIFDRIEVRTYQPSFDMVHQSYSMHYSMTTCTTWLILGANCK